MRLGASSLEGARRSIGSSVDALVVVQGAKALTRIQSAQG